MAVFRRVEEIIAWQKAGEITGRIYKISVLGGLERDFELRSQMRRASISIMANIAEGFGRNSDREFANFLNIAHGSAYELISHLYIASDLDYITPTEFDSLYRAVTEAARIIYGLRTSVLRDKA